MDRTNVYGAHLRDCLCQRQMCSPEYLRLWQWLCWWSMPILTESVSRVSKISFRSIDLFTSHFSDDPQLVQCFRRADCSAASRISNATVSLGYCCGVLAGTAASSAGGSCTPCTATDDDLANATITQAPRKLNFATCVLWGRDHIRTFDGLMYDFQGA